MIDQRKHLIHSKAVIGVLVSRRNTGDKKREELVGVADSTNVHKVEANIDWQEAADIPGNCAADRPNGRCKCRGSDCCDCCFLINRISARAAAGDI